jgi:hypothetical protein
MRDVPEDEAREVKELLEKHEIEFFETYSGNWGISMPALWLKNIKQFELAREILDEYQRERTERIRNEHQLNKERNEVKTMWHSFKERPLQFTTYSLIIILVLYLSIKFFVFF